MSIATVLPYEALASGQDLGRILAKPLILGASVSADLRTTSPGKRLALRHTSMKNLKVKAASGQLGKRTLAQIRDSDLADRTVLIGVDLFFWDSFVAESGPSLKAMQDLIEKSESMDLPLVLGEVPELVSGFQPSRAALNREMQRLCTAKKHCWILPLEKIYRQIQQDGVLQFKDKSYTFAELVPDGLHLSAPAADYLADVMEDGIKSL